MRLVDHKLRARFRGPGLCEWCARPVGWRDCHHIFGRGAGGVDIPGNLVALCVPFVGGDDCHGLFHRGHIRRGDLLAVAAAREGCTQGDIEHDVYLIRRLPKGLSAEDIHAMPQLRSLRVGQRAGGLPGPLRKLLGRPVRPLRESELRKADEWYPFER